MFTVQPLKTEKDALEIIDFFYSNDAFRITWAPGEKDMLKKAVLESLKDSDSHQYWFVAEQGNIIGALGINENIFKSGGYEMAKDYFAVHQDYRRKGIGSVLFQTMEHFVKEKNGRYIHIETCDTEYFKPAQTFYEKRGYARVGAMPDYYNVGEGRIDYFKKL